jgi:hypothetical protein
VEEEEAALNIGRRLVRSSSLGADSKKEDSPIATYVRYINTSYASIARGIVVINAPLYLLSSGNSG